MPPSGLVPSRQRWRQPFIYQRSDIEALMAHARLIRWPLPAATHETVIGLLAATGMRVGEALKLDRSDIDWARGVLLIRESKFDKTRQIPVAATTMAALDHYGQVRDALCPRPATVSFFVSMRGARFIYPVFGQVFRRLCDETGIGTGSTSRPRVHDYADLRVMPILVWGPLRGELSGLLRSA